MISNTIEHNQKAESYSLIQAKNIILNDTELQTIAKEKLQPIITERFGGYGVSVNKVKEPKEAVPRIYVIEEYQTASYLGSYGAGKAMQTLSLMPGESTTITVKTYKDSTTTKHSAENLLDSMSQSSAAEMESLIEEENEQAYVVTTDGTISKLITGTDGIVDTDGVIDELKAKKLTPAFDIHTHPIIIKEDTDGIVKEFVGHAFPSIQDRKDTKIQEDKGSISQPNWVLGFFKYVSKYEKRFERRINFYTSSWEAIREKDIYPPPEKNAETYTESDQGMNFLKFKKAVKDIWKYVLPLIFLLFSVNSYSQFPRSVKSYIDVYYKYKDVLDKQDTLKIVEFPLFKECAKHGYFCFSSVRMHQYVKTNRNTIICRVASIRNMGDSLIRIDNKCDQNVTVSKNAKMPDKKWCSEAAYSIEIPLENSDTGKLKSYEDSQRISIIPDKIVNGYANPERPRELYRGLCNKEQAKYNLTMEEFLEEMTRLSNDTELSKSRFLNTPLLLYKHFYKEDKTPCILYGTDSIDKDRSWGYRIAGNLAIFLEHIDPKQMKYFIRIAESLKEISLDEFNIHELPNYLKYKDVFNNEE